MSFTKSNNLVYATNKFLDGYIPTHPILVAGEKTVIVYVHGGGFRAGNEENKVAKDFCEYMASSGYYSTPFDTHLMEQYRQLLPMLNLQWTGSFSRAGSVKFSLQGTVLVLSLS